MVSHSNNSKNAWKNHRENWFKAEKEYEKLLINDGHTIVAHRGGYPDFMHEVDNKICFTEVKTNSDALEHEQKKVMNKLRNAGFDVRLIRYESKTKKFKIDKSWIDKNI